MAQRLRDHEPRRRLVSPRRKQQPLATHARIVRQRHPEITRPARSRSLRFAHAHARDDLHARRRRRARQTIHDRRRIIRHRKHPPVVLGFRFHAAFSEPSDHIARLKFMKRPHQFPSAARIFFHEFPRLETRMGDIATPTTRHAHFRERMRRRLVNRHVTRRAQLLCAGDGREISRCPTADNHHAPFVHHSRTLRTARGQSHTFFRTHRSHSAPPPHHAPPPSAHKKAVAGCNPQRRY